jgi:hypothetical protein
MSFSTRAWPASEHIDISVLETTTFGILRSALATFPQLTTSLMFPPQ